MRRPLLTVAVAALVVLAGCSGLGGSETSTPAETSGSESPAATAEPTPEESPASTPDGTDSPTAGPGSTPATPSGPSEPPSSEPVEDPRASFSWLTDSGVNESLLVRAHAFTVMNTSGYTTQATQRTVALDSANETVTRYRLSASADQQRSLYSINRTLSIPSTTRTDLRTEYREVTDGSQTIYYRTAVDGNVSYRVDDEPFRNFSTFYRQSTGYELTFLLTEFALTYNGTVQRDGQPLYRHTADSFRPESTFAGNASNASATVLVTDSGVIRSMEYSYEATSGGVPVRITYTFETTGLGGVTVQQPGWVDDAQSS
jgi:hypothetical protein